MGRQAISARILGWLPGCACVKQHLSAGACLHASLTIFLPPSLPPLLPTYSSPPSPAQQKSATTSLFHHLGEHPQLYSPSEKEPEFFSYECEYSPASCPVQAQATYINEVRCAVPAAPAVHAAPAVLAGPPPLLPLGAFGRLPAGRKW